MSFYVAGNLSLPRTACLQQGIICERGTETCDRYKTGKIGRLDCHWVEVSGIDPRMLTSKVSRVVSKSCWIPFSDAFGNGASADDKINHGDQIAMVCKELNHTPTFY